MEKLSIYKEDDLFVIEGNHKPVQTFSTEEAFREELKTFKDTINDYELVVSNELWNVVINYLGSKEFQA